MEAVVGIFLVGYLALSSAIGLWLRARRNTSRRPKAVRIGAILLGLLGVYVMLLVGVFLLQPLFNP